MDGVAGEYLSICCSQWIQRAQRDFYLRAAVFGVQLADRHSVACEIAQQLNDESVDVSQCIGRVRGTTMCGTAIGLVGENELQFVTGAYLVPGVGRAGDLALEHSPLVVRPGRSVGGYKPTGDPRETGLTGEGYYSTRGVEGWNQTSVAGRRGQPLVGERDAVVGIEHREHRRYTDSAAGRCVEFGGRNHAAAYDPIVVDPPDDDADDPVVGEVLGKSGYGGSRGIGHAVTLAKNRVRSGLMKL